jgi:AcrR family transcriptional regulator
LPGNEITMGDPMPHGTVSQRRKILRTAADLATVEGLDGLSIGGLAAKLHMSKSGLYAYFKSKEDLQLATVELVAEIRDEVINRPAMQEATPLAQLCALCENYYAYLSLFPGGCFFASIAAEFDARPGPVRDILIAGQERWLQLLSDLVAKAQQDGSLANLEEPRQLAFELNSYMHLGNDAFVLSGDETFIKMGRRAIARLLGLPAISQQEARLSASVR